jgi:hypothetical protein
LQKESCATAPAATAATAVPNRFDFGEPEQRR